MSLTSASGEEDLDQAATGGFDDMRDEARRWIRPAQIELTQAGQVRHRDRCNRHTDRRIDQGEFFLLVDV